jgi:hypothetical protein
MKEYALVTDSQGNVRVVPVPAGMTVGEVKDLAEAAGYEAVGTGYGSLTVAGLRKAAREA